MIFKRLSLVSLLLTLVSSYAWAEKYEFVSIKSKESDLIETETEDAYYADPAVTWYYQTDSITLKDGDLADVLSDSREYNLSLPYIFVQREFGNYIYSTTDKIAGPCTISIKYSKDKYRNYEANFSPDFICNFQISRSSDRSSPIEYVNLFTTNEKLFSFKYEERNTAVYAKPVESHVVVKQVDASLKLENGDKAILIGFGGEIAGLNKRRVNFYIEDESGRFYDMDDDGVYIGPCTLHLVDSERNKYTSELCFTFSIKRGSDTGSKTIALNATDSVGTSGSKTQQANNNSSSPVPDPNGIKYDSVLGWVWFTDTPWMYSYTNGSWYYMRSSNDGIYVWNANLPNSGWMKLRG